MAVDLIEAEGTTMIASIKNPLGSDRSSVRTGGFRHRPSHRRTSLSLCGLVIAALFAQAVLASDTRPIRFDRLSIEDGLSQATVLAIHQDQAGFMWFGTEDGLDRFDGYDFVQFRHDPTDPESISSGYVWAIAEGPSGDLWVATDGGGLSRHDRTSGSFTNYRAGDDGRSGPPSDHLRAMQIAPSGVVWIATRADGLASFDPESSRFASYRHDAADPTSLSDDHVFAIWIDDSGSVWVGTDGGLDRLDDEGTGFIHYRHDPADPSSLSDNRVRSLHGDADAGLWVGTRDGGLNQLDPESGVFERFQNDPDDATSLSSNRVRAILEDGAGRLWLGTIDGLNLMDRSTGSFTRYFHDPTDLTSLSANDVISLYQDRGGVIWVGTQLAGLSRWNPKIWSFGHHKAVPSDPHELRAANVTSFAEDRAGRLWVGTVGGGISVLDRISGTYTHFGSGPAKRGGLSSDIVMALLNDHQGAMWIGTLDGGLSRYDPTGGTFTHFRNDPGDETSLGSDGVMSLFEDDGGTLWVGTFGGGLNRFNRATQTFARFTHDPENPASLSSNRITCIAAATSGQLWLGTDGGGLELFDPQTGSARHFNQIPGDPEGLGSNSVYSLHVDPNGRLWVGTRGGGLAILLRYTSTPSTAQFRSYMSKDGLPSETIYGILPDSEGGLWLSTNRGLSRFDRATETFRNFRPSHGLQSDEFNFGAHYLSTTGEMMFGGINGFNAFYPERLEKNTAVPPVVMTDFLKSNRTVELPGQIFDVSEIELGYRDDVVTFEFAALDFTAPAENRYAYKLEGFDEEWIDLGTTRRVTFTDLAGGHYVLRVRGSNNEGVWNEAGVAVDLEVAPPPWQTWWAYTLYGLMLASVVFVAWRAQQRKLQREEEYSGRLEEEVRLQTGELRERAHELEDLNQQLVEASLTDTLTGLRNRRFFFKQVAKDIALVRRRYRELAKGIQQINVYDLAFMMVDLDDFKPVNDSFGHAAGDKVLVDVRGLLLESVRDSDIVIRWGGDEFLVIGRDSDPRKAEVLAERIRSTIAEHVFEVGDGQVARLTCSVGFACYPFVREDPDAIEWEQTLALADAALYAAKATSKNAWVGYLSSPSATVASAELIAAIREEPTRLRQMSAIEVRSSIPSERWVISP